MPTIIDSLVVTLGLDGAGYKKGVNDSKKELDELGKKADAQEKQQAKFGENKTKRHKLNQQQDKETAKAEKEHQDRLKNLASEATKFLAVIGGTAAVKSFVSSILDSNAALYRFSQNIELSVTQVSAWANANEVAGGSAQGMQSTMDMLSKAQTQLQLTGESALLPYFYSLGVAFSDASGKARPVTDMLLDLSDKFSHMDRRQAYNMGQMMGIDPGTMNLLLKGRQEVDLMVRKQAEYNAVTKNQAEQSEKTRQQMVLLKQEFVAFGNRILEDAMPALETLVKWLQDSADWMAKNKETVEVFLGALAVGLAAIAITTAPISLVVLGVIALAAAIALLYDDYQTWKRGGDSLIDWGKWSVGIEYAKKGIRYLVDLIQDLTYRAAGLGGVVANALTGNWDGVKDAWDAALHGNGVTYGQGGASPATSAPAPASPAPSGVVSSSGGGSNIRGIRNNNPGNLNFAGQSGATLESGPNARFAKFKTMPEGIAALVRQLGLYATRGKNTVRSIISTYAPASDNNNTSAYIASVAKSLGVGEDQPLNLQDAAIVRGMVSAITTMEVGRGNVSAADINQGMTLAGVPGASQFASGAGAVPKAASAMQGIAGGGGDKTINNNIGGVTIYSHGAGNEQVTADFGRTMDDYLTGAQANMGAW